MIFYINTDFIRNLNPLKKIAVVLNDLPDNNWNVTHNTIFEGLKIFKDVFILFAPKSFREPLVPNRQINLAFSFIAIHYLSNNEYCPVPRSAEEAKTIEY